MPIRTAPRLTRAIRSDPGRIVVQVLGPQPTEAAEALRLARRDILALDAGWQSAPGLEPGDTNGPKSVSALSRQACRRAHGTGRSTGG